MLFCLRWEAQLGQKLLPCSIWSLEPTGCIRFNQGMDCGLGGICLGLWRLGDTLNSEVTSSWNLSKRSPWGWYPQAHLPSLSLMVIPEQGALEEPLINFQLHFALLCSISVTESTQESWGQAGQGCQGAEFWVQVPTWQWNDPFCPFRALRRLGGPRNHFKSPVQDTAA